jgi:uncharacterized protein
MNTRPNSPMRSAIFHGKVRHRRLRPVDHEFTYRMFMMYLDLAELPRVFDGSCLFSSARWALARFRREDHLGDPGTPLDAAVRDLVEERTGQRPDGPIALLTHLRYFGYVFNPVSFYYCFDTAGERVQTIVAEVNNTPWNERHCYVLPRCDTGPARPIQRFQPAKAMHVSPFMPMDMDYDWRFRDPDERLAVHMQNSRGGLKLFSATLSLERREITPAALARVLVAFPLMTVKIMAAIHWQALRLWLKGCPVYDHPAKRKLIENRRLVTRPEKQVTPQT